MMPEGTHLEIYDALYSHKSKWNSLGFKDIRMNGLHIETMGKGKKEFLLIYENSQGQRKVLETLPTISIGLHWAKINMIED